jgi:hypothetical protein
VIVLLKITDCSPWSRNSCVILDKRQSSNGLSLLLPISNNVIMQAYFLQGPIMSQQLVIWYHFGLPKQRHWIHVSNMEMTTHQTQTQPANRHIIVFPSKNTGFIKDKTFLGEGEEGKRSSQHCNNDISMQVKHSRERCNDPTAQSLHCWTKPQDPCRTGMIAILWKT